MDLLRSCYTTQFFPFAGEDYSADLKWYFTHPGAEVLPFSTAINSRNWQDKHQRSQLVDVGEDPTAPRPWSNGKAPLAAHGTRYCGIRSDYLGAGDFADPPQVIIPDGVPACCGYSDELWIQSGFSGWKIELACDQGGLPVPLVAQPSSFLAFYEAQTIAMISDFSGQLSIRLYKSVLSANPDSASDFVEPDYPGYAPIDFNIEGIVLPDDPGMNEYLTVDPVTFQATANPASAQVCHGAFIVDPGGNTMGYGDFTGGPFTIAVSGDFINISPFWRFFYFFA